MTTIAVAGVLATAIDLGCSRDIPPAKDEPEHARVEHERSEAPKVAARGGGEEVAEEPTPHGIAAADALIAKSRVAAAMSSPPPPAADEPAPAKTGDAPPRVSASTKPAELLGFERAVGDLREVSPGSARGSMACANRKALSTGDDIDANAPPPGIDPEAWRDGAETIGVAVQELSACCQENLGVDPECAESMLVSAIEGLDTLQAFFEDGPQP